MEEILADLGYNMEDDSWDTDGRRSFSHDSDATAPYLRSLCLLLGPYGFRIDRNNIRTLRADDGQIIELEPGGFECPGHLLHHIKAEPVA